MHRWKAYILVFHDLKFWMGIYFKFTTWYTTVEIYLPKQYHAWANSFECQNNIFLLKKLKLFSTLYKQSIIVQKFVILILKHYSPLKYVSCISFIYWGPKITRRGKACASSTTLAYLGKKGSWIPASQHFACLLKVWPTSFLLNRQH